MSETPRLTWSLRQSRLSLWRLLPIILGLLVVAAGVAWQYRLLPQRRSLPNQNAIMVIAPYRTHGTWVFDDPTAGLKREPFVQGVPEMIDRLVEEIPNADDGFRLLFSRNEFPGYKMRLTWIRSEKGGNWYRLDDPKMEGWLCPALFAYFEEAPQHLFVKAEPMALEEDE